MERPRDPQLELLIRLREEMAEMRATVRHLGLEMPEVKQDLRRLDDRLFQLMLIQIATLVATVASLATALATALAS